METVGLVLGLAKIALEIFKDERKGRFVSDLDKVQREWQDEMAKSDDERSDLKLDRLLFDSKQLAQSIIDQHNKIK